MPPEQDRQCEAIPPLTGVCLVHVVDSHVDASIGYGISLFGHLVLPNWKLLAIYICGLTLPPYSYTVTVGSK